MCSICRNPNCQYSWSKDTWQPGDDLRVINLPDSDLTFLELVRIGEELLRQAEERSGGLLLKGSTSKQT